MSQIGSEKYLKPPPPSSEHIDFSKLQNSHGFPISACHWKESVTPPYDQRRNGFHALLLLKHCHRAPCCVHGTSWMGKTHGSLNVGENRAGSGKGAQSFQIKRQTSNKKWFHVLLFFTCFRTHFFKFGEKTSCQIDNQLNLLPYTTALLIEISQQKIQNIPQQKDILRIHII